MYKHNNEVYKLATNKKMKQTFLVIALLITNHCCFSQTKMISKADANQDLDTLQKYIEEIHPNAYAYVSKEKINKRFKYTKENMADSLSFFDLYNVFSSITASYKDGHLSTLYPNRIWSEESPNVLPFTIEIENNKLFTKDVHEASNIPVNSEVVSINGIASSEIIDTLLKTTSGEAYHFKIERIKINFPRKLYAVYTLKGDFTVTYEHNGNIEKTTTKSISYKDYSNISHRNTQQESFSAKILEKEDCCIIDFCDFSNIEKFKIFCDSLFRTINLKNINNLIIDIRNNSGGNSELGDELFQYISTVPFKQYDQTEMKVSRHLKRLWESYYLPKGIVDSAEVNLIKSIKNDTIINPSDYFSLEEEDNVIQLRNNPDRFDGKVYLLISNYTFSSAADFAWCFKHYNMGEIIGEETGGLGLCYGDNVYAELPNSKIAINVSCKLFYNIGATDKSNHGVVPDVQIASEDALEKAMELVKKK